MNHAARRAMTCATALLSMPIGSTSVAQVVVNEVHYRPSRSAVSRREDAVRLQFVELYNAGTRAVDLSGWSVASAVRFTFPDGTSIAPSEYVVVAADPGFLSEHGPSIPADVRVFGWERGDLAAGRVQLVDSAKPSGSVVDDVAYARDRSWPAKANGGGSSLELVNPSIENGSSRAWRASSAANGTPGAANSVLGEPVVVSEAPARGASAAGVREIAVTFSEEMKHVKASDLIVDGVPARTVTGSGDGPYVFGVNLAGSGKVEVALRSDVLTSRNDRVFEGDTWQYFAPTATTLSMPDGANGGPGAIAQVPISATPGDGIFGIDMTLQYAASVVEAQDVTVSGIAQTAGFALVRNLNTPGTIIISMYATQNAMVGSGEIARIQFHVLGAPGSTSNLTFSSASINEGGIPSQLDPGLFTVTCAGAANGTACNDGNACTADEACQAGACTGGVTLVVPAEITNVRFGADHSTITWDSALAAGPGTVHDVARGLVSELPVGAGPGESCPAPGSAAATTSDASTPPISNAFWYLVRGRNACGVGSYGFLGVHGVPGAERTTSTCP
jgi:hypothetical protein